VIFERQEVWYGRAEMRTGHRANRAADIVRSYANVIAVSVFSDAPCFGESADLLQVGRNNA
jgi:hypothetical protein